MARITKRSSLLRSIRSAFGPLAIKLRPIRFGFLVDPTAAREQFNFLVSRLQSAEISRMEHGEVEATIAQESTELLRRLLQGHLDRRAKTEERCWGGWGYTLPLPCS